MNVREARYINTRRLIAKYGGVSAFAEKIGKSQSQASQIAGENPIKGIGNKIAAEIEAAYGLCHGWLDRDHSQEYGFDHINPVTVTKVPLISWAIAADLCQSSNPIGVSDAEAWMLCPFEHSEKAYCLRVVGDSMFPDYLDGQIILVDPSVDAVHGDDIVIKMPDGRTMFKRMQDAPEGRYLLSVNPEHPNRKIEAPQGAMICGVVTGSWMERRSRHPA